MTSEKRTFRTELTRFRRDPRVSVWLAMRGSGGLAAEAVGLVMLAADEIEVLEHRVAALELQLAGLGALTVNKR
jgi:hypothetical protein